MFDVIVIQAIFNTVVYTYEYECSEYEERVDEHMLEFRFSILTWPQYWFVKFIQNFDGLSVKFIKNWLVQRVNLQGSQLEIFVS